MDHIYGKDMRIADIDSAVRRQDRPSSFAYRHHHQVVKSPYPSCASWDSYQAEELLVWMFEPGYLTILVGSLHTSAR